MLLRPGAFGVRLQRHVTIIEQWQLFHLLTIIAQQKTRLIEPMLAADRSRADSRKGRGVARLPVG